ncbi:epoxide hydrolase family protein [Paenibacillus sp. Marseille-Q7038]
MTYSEQQSLPRSHQHAEIKPFRIDVSQGDLDDLRDRLTRTRWPDGLEGVGWEYGTPVDYLKELTEYWKSKYNWRKHEESLNQFPQFTTTIDGQNIHFIHVRSPESGAMPLIITHGWPSSIVEFMNIIGPLTNPRAHGGNPVDAFHVVIPSLPGFGFSGPTTEVGWNIGRVARAWAELMSLLGYERYGAQGGDTGALVSPELGRFTPDSVIGVHTNGLKSFPPGDSVESHDLTETERARYETLTDRGYETTGYAIIQSTRPQTLAYGLTDSPVGQLSWIVEKFKEWTDPMAHLPEDAVDLDQLLTNVTLYWLTGTAGSSSRIYKEEAKSWGIPAKRSKVPTAVAVFPQDVSIRRFVEREHNIIQWSEFNRGGHFAAMEAPDLLVNDIRLFFSQLR